MEDASPYLRLFAVGAACWKTNLSQPAPTLSSSNARDFAVDESTYLREFIALADQKAGFLFAVVAGMLAYLNSQQVAKLWMIDLGEWRLPHILAFVATVGLGASAFCCLKVIWPRLWTRSTPKGVIYWESIVETSLNGTEYADEVFNLTDTKIARAKLEHCYVLATIVSDKYKALNLAIWLGSGGLGASILYLAFA